MELTSKSDSRPSLGAIVPIHKSGAAAARDEHRVTGITPEPLPNPIGSTS